MRRVINIIFSNPLSYFILIFFVILMVISSQATYNLPGNPPNQNDVLLFTPTPTLIPIPGVPTPYPIEMLSRSAEQTNGIVLMGILLVLIVIWGTMSVIYQRK